jgi:hypothetical protein
MKVGDVVRSMRFPKLEGIVTEVSSYHGTITFRTARDAIYTSRPEDLEVVVECR